MTRNGLDQTMTERESAVKRSPFRLLPQQMHVLAYCHCRDRVGRQSLAASSPAVVRYRPEAP